jgi:hypothetical protein
MVGNLILKELTYSGEVVHKVVLLVLGQVRPNKCQELI